MTSRLTALLVVLTLAAACGGSGSSTPSSPTPTPTPTLPLSAACGAITASTASTLTRPAVVGGTECATDGSPVVLLNIKDTQGFSLGGCSGTVIAPRAILTAAHCLQPPAGGVLVFLGSGPQQTASSFATHPSWNASNPSNFDVGVVLMPNDIGRSPKPLLLSRDAQVGETAVIAGWGKESEFSASSTFRAGVTIISAVGGLTLQTAVSPALSSVCQGDSGGAIFVQNNGTWSVAGVISANTTLACSSGSNFYASVRAADNQSFILSKVPDAARQ